MRKLFFVLALIFFCVSPAFAATQQYDTQLYFFDAKTLGTVTPTTTLINVWVGIKGAGNVIGGTPTLNSQFAASGPGMEVYDLGGYLLPFVVINGWASDVISTNSNGEKIMPLTQVRIYDTFKGLPNHPPQGGIILNANFTLGQGDNSINLRASHLETFGTNPNNSANQ